MAYNSRNTGDQIDDAVEFIRNFFGILYDSNTDLSYYNGMMPQILNGELQWIQVLNAEEVSF